MGYRWTFFFFFFFFFFFLFFLFFFFFFFFVFFFFFFFLFYWLYNLGWVLVSSTILFHYCLSSTFALQPTIFILFRSSSTWSIHLNLGLPAGLVLYDVHSVIFLVVLVLSILITWAAHLSLCDFINFIISSCFILCLNSSFVLILHIGERCCPENRNLYRRGARRESRNV